MVGPLEGQRHGHEVAEQCDGDGDLTKQVVTGDELPRQLLETAEANQERVGPCPRSQGEVLPAAGEEEAEEEGERREAQSDAVEDEVGGREDEPCSGLRGASGVAVISHSLQRRERDREREREREEGM